MQKLRQLARLLASGKLTRTGLADQSGILMDAEGLSVYSLNETGLFLVDHLGAGQSDPAVLVRELVARFDIDEETARRDLERFVEDLHKLVVEKGG